MWYDGSRRKIYICVCICVCMVKVISLSNDAYAKLKALKGNDKSFSDVVIEIVAVKKRNIMEFAGIWKNDKEWDKIEKEIYVERKRAKLRDYKW